MGGMITHVSSPAKDEFSCPPVLSTVVRSDSPHCCGWACGLLALPLIAALHPLLGGVQADSLVTVGGLALLATLVGFTEELIFRGLVLRAPADVKRHEFSFSQSGPTGLAHSDPWRWVSLRQYILATVLGAMLCGCSLSQSLPGTILVESESALTRIHNGKAAELKHPGLTDLLASPDGRYLLGRQGDQWSIVQTGSTKLTPVSQTRDAAFQWSLQGDRLALAEKGQLRIIAVRSNTEATIPIDAAPTGRMAWAPNGEWLAFQVPATDGRANIYIADLATESAHLIFDDRGASVHSWSPDSKRLVMSYHTESGSVVVVFDRDSRQFHEVLNEKRLLASLPRADAAELDGLQLAVGWVAWSPDGQWLGYNAKAAGKGRYMVGAVSADGATLHTLLFPPGKLNLSSPSYRACHATHTYQWTGSNLLLRLAGDGCSSRLVLLEWPIVSVKQEWELQNPAEHETLLFAPDGSMALSIHTKTEWVRLTDKAAPLHTPIAGKPLGWFPSGK